MLVPERELRPPIVRAYAPRSIPIAYEGLPALSAMPRAETYEIETYVPHPAAAAFRQFVHRPHAGVGLARA